ncbi:MAG TPA: fluoride efflux transporter CrcB [Gemmatimonadota bacterium]|jgi:CrcB protein
MGILAIAAGGAIGAVLRYVLSGWVQELGGARFPWGTLAVNALGSLALGLIMAGLVEHSATGSVTRTFWTIGVLGAFTTFSTFSYETLALLTVGDWWGGVANVAANLGLGLGAALLGLRLGAL